LLRGVHARWTDAKKWHDRDGLPIPSPLLVIGSETAVQKWKDGVPEVITTKPLPDPEELNSKIPVSDWEIGIDGKPRPPWAIVFALYLVDWRMTGQIYTALNSTTGWRMAFEALQEQVAVKRMLHGGARLLPIVDLQSRPFPTNFGDRMRPHLQVVDWKAVSEATPLPSASGPVAQLAAPTTDAPAPKTVKESLDEFAKGTEKPQPQPQAPTGGLVDPPKPVSSEEFFDDQIPW